MVQKNTIPELSEKDLRRFWSKVVIPEDTDKCWEWKRRKNRGGYGNFDLKNRKTILAHRISYFIKYKIDPMQLCALHKCDNPACVNPAHLFLGTDMDNVHDMHKKGRFSLRIGENNINSKLKDKDVIEIRDRHKKEEISFKELAKVYNVSASVIQNVLNMNTWKHVESDYERKKLEYGNSKLNPEKVLEIRDRFNNCKNTVFELADIYNITDVSVYNIVNKKTWKHIG